MTLREITIEEIGAATQALQQLPDFKNLPPGASVTIQVSPPRKSSDAPFPREASDIGFQVVVSLGTTTPGVDSYLNALGLEKSGELKWMGKIFRK